MSKFRELIDQTLDWLAERDDYIRSKRLHKVYLQVLELGISDDEIEKIKSQKIELDEFFMATRQAEDDLVELKNLEYNDDIKESIVKEEKLLTKLLTVMHSFDEMLSYSDPEDIDGGYPEEFEAIRCLATPILFSANKSYERVTLLLQNLRQMK